MESAGTTSAQEQSLKMARKAGCVVIVGLTGGRDLTIDPDLDLMAKELDVKASFLSANAYQDALGIIQSGRFELKKMITHVYPLVDVEKAFQAVTEKGRDVIKVLLDPWASAAE